MANIVIQDCDVLNITGGKVNLAKNQTIAISGNRIASLTPAYALSLDMLVNDPQKQVLDGKGLLAVPGFINAHVHTPSALLRGLAEDLEFEDKQKTLQSYQACLTAEDVYWGSMLGLAEMIENGITCIADQSIMGEEVAKAVSGAGIRALLACSISERESSSFEDAVSFVQKWNHGAGGRITTWFGPDSLVSCPPALLTSIAQKAKELKTGIHIHVAESSAAAKYCRDVYGQGSIEILKSSGVLELPTLLAHGTYLSKDELRTLSETPCGIIHCPKTDLKLAYGIRDLDDFLSAGLTVGLGAGSAICNHNLDMLENLRLMVMLQKHQAGDSQKMPVDKALNILWHGSARAIQKANELGEIAPGKTADIVLFRQDTLHSLLYNDPAANLVYAMNGADADTVICDGKILMQKRQLLTIDKAHCKRQAQGCIQRIHKRLVERSLAYSN